MKKPWPALAILIVAAANTLALVEVARNRGGGPVETIELTERELPLQSMGQDNSAVGFLVRWSGPSAGNRETSFSRSQLEGIGFDLRLPAGTSGKDVSLLPRAALVVLEYDGAAYRRWLGERDKKAGAEGQEGTGPASQAGRNPVNQEDPLTASRLFPIDIGNDAPELRRRHPDQSHYLIMKGVIGVRIQEPADNDPNKAPRFIGSVWQILPNYINVPLPYSGTLAGLMPQAGKPPRYTVTLNFGHNLEPWVSSVVLTPGLPNSAF